ncbi:2709_t:CDS:2 [Paraglomus occultum]|uniref:2709_t:CDS:1 n=1 Tax=Paraglomus occultum TaxID=144539 RepID=A0A9N9B3T5_9GLOM|nr:2709_t:CDS:2 [Paraglomus occultum]
MPSPEEEIQCSSPYSPHSEDYALSASYYYHDNPETMFLDPKLEVLDNDNPLFFLTPQRTPNHDIHSEHSQGLIDTVGQLQQTLAFAAATNAQSSGLSQSMKNLQIQVLGVPQTGAKSRVETQIKLCLQLVTDKGEKVPLWSHLRLPEYMVAKEKLKTKNARNGQDQSVNIVEKGVLNLEATVVCASETLKQVTTCLGCVQRED